MENDPDLLSSIHGEADRRREFNKTFPLSSIFSEKHFANVPPENLDSVLSLKKSIETKLYEIETEQPVRTNCEH
jgi:hypothetical protein